MNEKPIATTEIDLEDLRKRISVLETKQGALEQIIEGVLKLVKARKCE